MLECWRHSAARRPSFIELLDHLVPDLTDQFRDVAYYFNHEPLDTVDAADDADDRLTDSHSVAAETVSAPLHAELGKSEWLQSGGFRNLPDPGRLSGFSSADWNESASESVEMANLLPAADEPDRHRQTSREPARSSCGGEVRGAAEAGGKDSSGSSRDSHKVGLINGHVIPFNSALWSGVH